MRFFSCQVYICISMEIHRIKKKERRQRSGNDTIKYHTSINQTINQLINSRSVRHSVKQPVRPYVRQSDHQSVSLTVNQSINKSVSQSINSFFRLSVFQSVSPSVSSWSTCIYIKGCNANSWVLAEGELGVAAALSCASAILKESVFENAPYRKIMVAAVLL